MSLSKQQTIAAVGGGVFALGVAVLGWMIFSAWSDLRAVKGGGGEVEPSGDEEEMAPVEESSGLETEMESFRSFQALKPYPDAASIARTKNNCAAYAQWSSNSLAFVSRADRKFDVASGAMLQDMIKTQVKKMSQLRGGAIATPEFKFGFDNWYDNIEDSDAVRARLMIQLDTVFDVVSLFDKVGVLEVKSVQLVEPKKEDDEGDGAPARKKKGGKKAKPGEKAYQDNVLEYNFEVVTRPAGIVELLNALTSASRFYEVRKFAFVQVFDRISDNINKVKEDKEKAAEGKSSAGRRRRRGQLAETPPPVEATPKAVSRVVADLESDADKIQVNFTLAVHDFGRAETNAAVTEATNEVRKGDK